MKDLLISTELTEAQKFQVAKLIYESFPEMFSNYWIFEKNPIKAVNVLDDCIDFKNGFYAIKDGKVIGVIGLTYYHNNFLKFHVKILKKYFGFSGSLWRTAINRLDHNFNVLGPKDVYIEFLVVSPEYRNLGIGSLLIESLVNFIKLNNLGDIFLDVVDTNPKAQQLYSKLGFKIFKTINFRGITRSMGFRKDILMKKKVSK